MRHSYNPEEVSEREEPCILWSAAWDRLWVPKGEGRGTPIPINWWKILTVTAAQNNLGQGQHLLYTVGFRLSLWGSASNKGESSSWIAPLGLRSWFTSTLLSNTKESISPLINPNATLIISLPHVRASFPNLAIKTVNFYFAWIHFIYFLTYRTWSVWKMNAAQLQWVHCFARSRRLWTEKPTKACKQVYKSQDL